MKNHLAKEKAIGICFEGTFFEYCKVEFLNNKFTISELGSFSINDVKPLDIEIEKETTVVLCILANSVLVRPLDLPVVKEKDIERTFRFQLEPQLPFSIDEAVIEKILLSKTKNSCQLLTFSCHKPEIEKILHLASTFQIDPEILVPKPLSLYAFHQSFSDLSSVLYAIDVQQEESTCLLFIDGLLIQARSLVYGIKNLEMAFSSIPDNIEQEQKIELLLPQLHEFFKELKRILLTFELIVSKVKPDYTQKELSLTGPIVRYGVLKDVLTKFLECEQKDFHFENCIFKEGILKEAVIANASSVGAAILQSSFWIKKHDVNFRRNEFQYIDQFKKWKNPLLTYCSIAFVLFLTSLFFGNILIGKKTKHIEQSLENVVSILYPENQRDSLKGIEDIQGKIENIEAECRKSYEVFPLEPDIPLVYDVLSWLAKRPQMQNPGSESDRMVLQNFSYLLVKRPEKGRVSEHYQVQVFVEFSCSDPMLARQFHEDLLKPNDFIDPKGEIGWTQNKNLYRTSFYLKDRTNYSNYGGVS